MVTLTSVDVSPDVSHALVYFTCLDAKQAEATACGSFHVRDALGPESLQAQPRNRLIIS